MHIETEKLRTVIWSCMHRNFFSQSVYYLYKIYLLTAMSVLTSMIICVHWTFDLFFFYQDVYAFFKAPLMLHFLKSQQNLR